MNEFERRLMDCARVGVHCDLSRERAATGVCRISAGLIRCLLAGLPHEIDGSRTDVIPRVVWLTGATIDDGPNRSRGFQQHARHHARVAA
jgi:hypothetical protein